MTDARRWFNVGVVKLPHAERDVARAALGDRPDRERFQDIVGADTFDTDDRFPVGSNCTYRAALTDTQAAQFRAASNVRYVEEDVTFSDVTAGAVSMPGWRVRDTLGYWASAPTSLPGTSVDVAVLDTGTSSLARAYMGHTLVARGVFPASQPPVNETYPGADHGSLCASDAVSPGGRLLDGIVIDGNNQSTDGIVAQGITWAVNQGAKVVSGSFALGWNPIPATYDALAAAAANDVVFFFATGNDVQPTLVYPAMYSVNGGLPHVYSVGGWDMSSRYKWAGANYHPQMTGVAPSIMVFGLVAAGTEAEWYGTSAACPCVANMCARLIGAGFTARDAAAALAATTDRKGLSASAVGGGLFSLRAAAAQLGIIVPPNTVVDARTQRLAAPFAGQGGPL